MAQPGIRTDRPDGWSNYMAQQPNHAHSPSQPRDFQAHDSLHQALKTMPTEPDTEYHEHVKPGSTEDSGTRNSSNMQSTRALLGLNPSAPVAEEHDIEAYSSLWWFKVRMALREPFAEFFGVFIMVLFGDGSVAQVLLSAGEKTAPGMDGFGSYQSINWGWGLGVMLGKLNLGSQIEMELYVLMCSRRLCCGRQWRVSESGYHLYELSPSPASMAALSRILARTVSRWICCFGSRLCQLYQRNQCL